MKHILTLTAATALLASCGEQTSTYFPSLDQEAGVVIDQGQFGNASMNNMLVQTGASDMTVNLNNRFQAETSTTVNFAFNSSTLDETAKATLRRQADWIRQFPEIKFRVYGHTDLVGGNAFNQRLGRARANAVVNYLTTQGISRSRLEALVSFGETQPLIATQNPERANRRTVTEVSGFTGGGSATELNGKYAAVIFREYVSSAVPPQGTQGETAGGRGDAGGGGEGG